MRTPGIYLHEGDEFIGPFYRREDAERFLILVGLFGGNLIGAEIVSMRNRAPLGAGKHPRLPRQKLFKKTSTLKHEL